MKSWTGGAARWMLSRSDCTPPGQLRRVLPDGRQPGDAVAAERGAVVADERDILRNPQPEVPDRPDRAERDHIAEREERRDARVALEQPPGALIPVLHRIAARFMNPLQLARQAVALHGPLHPQQPPGADLRAGAVAAEHMDAPVAALVQVVDRLLRRALVMRGKAREVWEAELPRAVGQQHGGHGDAGEFRRKTPQVAAEEEEALGMAQLRQPQGVLHLVLVLVQIGHVDLLAAALQQGLYLLQNVGKQQVLHPLDQHGDGGRRLHLQMPCVGVGLKAVLLHHRKHPRLGPFAHVRMVVEHPGHGAKPVPGQPGNICDRHVPLRAPRGEGQPFTAPATTPLMIYFCANR